jgi:hypothetical protein
MGDLGLGEQRAEACAALLRQARSIVNAYGTGEAALEKIKGLLVGLANQGEALGPGVDYPYTCATGNRAACRSELRAGRVSMLPYSDNALSVAQAAEGKILACRARPLSDLELAWLGQR